MNKSVIIAVAPTGGWGAGRNNPLTPEDIASEVIASSNAGAAVVHLHSRDRAGRLTADMSFFNETIELIKQQSDIILEASTGGLSELDAVQRACPVGSRYAEMGSLNIGSLNFGDFVYRNSLPDVRFWIEEMARRGVKPSLEIFDTGHLETALHLIDEGLVEKPCNFSFIFNVQWGMKYDKELLSYLISRLPAESCWGTIFIGSSDFKPHLEAIGMGAASVRVGFEDSLEYNGRTAVSNGELVLALRDELEHNGYIVSDPQETRLRLLHR
ncbi:MAG: 3-keto-5-aminohexanoate cleavage protein [Desulfocapsaceae bacterium]|jgi:3-keto-5-aminohexanoate cleavage enzyme|nr:3-keto-5-aminohexanoate cleavage protein [Desulfocapsaceae bacterium]